MKNFLHITGLGMLAGLCAFMGQDKLSLRSAFAPVAARSSGPETSKYQGIGLADALQFYYRPNVLFLDVRDPAYFSHGHITGAINAMISQTPADAPVLNLIKQHSYCVIYCSNSGCGAAAASALRLSQLGVTNLLVYSGGWEEWAACHLPATVPEDQRL
jgi:rhodanese-related sulfurtransferase